MNIISQNQKTLEIRDNYLNELYDNYNLKYNSEKSRLDFSQFKYDQYYNDHLKATESNFWFKKDGWSVARAFLANNFWCIPTSLLGALFHDKVGRDLTPKINDYFSSEISPYLVTGGLFGVVGTLVFAILLKKAHYPLNELTKPWIYSMSLMQGFLVGATAMAGAYFGDEAQQTDELSDSQTADHIELNP